VTKPKVKNTKTYRQLSEQLADILAWFESQDIDLDQAVAKYEQATQLLDQMERYLKNAENKVRKINAKFG